MDLWVIKQKLAAHRRTAYVPRVVGREVLPDQSKFAGVAWINEGDTWPACGYCGKPMQLLLQLSLSELPVRFEGWPERGFVQVFYCTVEETYCEQAGKDAFSPFGKFLCARVLNPTNRCAFTSSPVENPLPAKGIVGWEGQDDYPSWEEVNAIAPGLLSEEDVAQLGGEHKLPTLWADKLGGWQVGPQGVRRPLCPECGLRMTYFFQIGDRDNLDYMFGDCGIAHLFRCEAHPHTLGFEWEGC
jgi:hypothetical protein